jgi:hypothetical protein
MDFSRDIEIAIPITPKLQLNTKMRIKAVMKFNPKITRVAYQFRLSNSLTSSIDPLERWIGAIVLEPKSNSMTKIEKIEIDVAIKTTSATIPFRTY